MPTDRVNRGKIHHINTVYGSSTKGAPLEVYFPQNESEIDVLLMAGIHGDEPEGTVLLSEALRYILPEELTKAQQRATKLFEEIQQRKADNTP